MYKRQFQITVSWAGVRPDSAPVRRASTDRSKSLGAIGNLPSAKAASTTATSNAAASSQASRGDRRTLGLANGLSLIHI